MNPTPSGATCAASTMPPHALVRPRPADLGRARRSTPAQAAHGCLRKSDPQYRARCRLIRLADSSAFVSFFDALSGSDTCIFVAHSRRRIAVLSRANHWNVAPAGTVKTAATASGNRASTPQPSSGAPQAARWLDWGVQDRSEQAVAYHRWLRGVSGRPPDRRRGRGG